MKLVSVVMPTYQRDLLYVERAVQSLLDQNYNNMEILIIDDSPDTYENRSAIKAYILNLRDPRIRFIQNERNLGGALARNVGIRMAKGYYTTFLDDDDRYLPEKISAQVAFMDETGYDMSFSNMLIKTMGEVLIDVRNYSNVWSFEQEEFLKYHLMRHATGTPTFMYVTEKLQSIGGFDDARMGQEFYLMLKTIERGLSIGYLDVYHVVVYKHKGDAISKGDNKIIGENELYERKKSYFHLLSQDQISFVRMRHYAVLAVAYKRNGDYLGMISNLFKAFFAAPTHMLKEGVKFVLKVFEQRRRYAEKTD